MTQNDMVGWHHQLNGHEFEQTLGNSKGQGRLVCCSPWGCKESDITEQLNNKKAEIQRFKVVDQLLCSTFTSLAIFQSNTNLGDAVKRF